MNIRSSGLRNNRGRTRRRPTSSFIHSNRNAFLVVFALAAFLALLRWAGRQRNGSSGNSNNESYQWNRRHWYSHNRSPSNSLLYAQKDKYSHRIAMLLPYATSPNDSSMPSILSYFTLFCYGAAGAADRIDFFIFHTGIFAATNGTNTLPCPPNVIFVNLQSHRGLAQHLIRVVDHKYDDTGGDSSIRSEKSAAAMKYDELLDLIASFVQVNPYGLVEFKPALGHIFQEYIVNYTHWGYSDFDILFGDVNRWITNDELMDFDLVTYTFGDQQRLYMRGQFTFHKNLPHTINQLWRGCSYLSDIDIRFDQIVQQTHKYHVESAEGCYSAVLMEQRNISIKFAVKAWTDIYTDDTVYMHGVGYSRSPDTGRQVLYKMNPNATRGSGAVIDRLRSNWFEKQDSVYMDHLAVGLQRLVGEKIPIQDSFEKFGDKQLDTLKPCMYWALPAYQSKLCLKQDAVSSEDAVFWINGTLYKQRYENALLTHSGVITTPLFHFQEWKRSFRFGQIASMYLSSTVETFVLTPEGAVPMISESVNRIAKNRETNVSPLGISNMKSWTAVLHNDRSQLPLLSYCIQSSVDGSHKYPRCDTVVSWQDHARTKILVPAPGWVSQMSVEKDVTLVLTMQLSSRYVHPDANNLHDVIDHLQTSINLWYGKPCVVVISIPESLDESTINYLLETFNIATNLDLHSCLIALVIHPHDDDVISSKALMNMAIDAVPTRWYISGLDLERGLTISPDSLYFAHRTVSSFSGLRGNIFLIPQFAVDDTNFSGRRGDISEQRTGVSPSFNGTIDNLLLAKRNNNVKHPSEFEPDCSESEKLPPLFHRIEEIWLSETLNAIGLATTDQSLDQVVATRVDMLENLQLHILEMAKDASEVDEYSLLYSYNESPLLLTDNLGPHQGIRTNEIVREIEEFNGQRCFNGVRLTQLIMLGYALNVLPVAFASSTSKSRGVFDHSSDTDDTTTTCKASCFNYEEENFWVLSKIATVEMKRAAKSAVMWAEYLGWKQPVPSKT